MITPMAFGKMCLKIILPGPAPATLAASTNSLSRKDRNSARTSRDNPVHKNSPKKNAKNSALPPEKAFPTTAPRISTGMMMITSVKRIKTESSHPLK